MSDALQFVGAVIVLAFLIGIVAPIVLALIILYGAAIFVLAIVAIIVSPFHRPKPTESTCQPPPQS